MGAEGHQDGTVGKALDVLDMVARHGRPVRFSDLLAQSDYPKATLFRLLQTLANQGMLSLDPDTGTYSLGVRLVRLERHLARLARSAAALGWGCDPAAAWAASWALRWASAVVAQSPEPLRQPALLRARAILAGAFPADRYDEALA